MLAPQPTDLETAKKFRGYTGVIGPLNGPCLRKGARPVFAGIPAPGKDDAKRFQVGLDLIAHACRHVSPHKALGRGVSLR